MNRFQHFPEKAKLRKRKFFSVSVFSDWTLTLCGRAADCAADLDADVQALQRLLMAATRATQAVVSVPEKAQPRPFYAGGGSVLGWAK